MSRSRLENVSPATPKEPSGDPSKLMTRGGVEHGRRSVGHFPLASSVAQLGMLLRDSPHKGDAAFEKIPPLVAEDFAKVVRMAMHVERTEKRASR